MRIDDMEAMRPQKGTGQQQKYRFRHQAAGNTFSNHGNNRRDKSYHGQRDKFTVHNNLLLSFQSLIFDFLHYTPIS